MFNLLAKVGIAIVVVGIGELLRNCKDEDRSRRQPTRSNSVNKQNDNHGQSKVDHYHNNQHEDVAKVGHYASSSLRERKESAGVVTNHNYGSCKPDGLASSSCPTSASSTDIGSIEDVAKVKHNVPSSHREPKESAGTLVTDSDYGSIKPDGLASSSCPTFLSSTDIGSIENVAKVKHNVSSSLCERKESAGTLVTNNDYYGSIKPDGLASSSGPTSVHSTDIGSIEYVAKVKHNVSLALYERKEYAGTLDTNNEYGSIKSNGLASSSGPTSVSSTDIGSKEDVAKVKHNVSSSLRERKESAGTLVTNNVYGSIKPDGLASSSCLTSVSSTDTSKNAKKVSAYDLTTEAFSFASKEANNAYDIPENMVDLIKKNTVPNFFKKPLSSSSYTDFFAYLLYAEDYYIEKWSEFCLSNVTLELHDAKYYNKLTKVKSLRDDKPLVAFQIDSIPEKRPYLLSRDFVFVRPSGKNVEPFQGNIHCVVRSRLVLVEFKEDFHSQHHPHREYDVSFSFNRVCLKRCHKAIETVPTKSSLQNFLFPKPMTKLSSVNHIEKAFICRLKGAPPYLIEGPQSATSGKLSPTGTLIRDMIFAILNYSQKSRILVCAPQNNTCDILMRSLRLKLPGSDLFRANAAFREFDDVPDDILVSCLYEGECFTCPSLEDLNNFKVIISTFVSSFRLNNEGLSSGHFTHIIMVDASSATEPETTVPLANFAEEETGILVTGTQRNFPGRVRSNIGRKYGLQKSYFQRLLEMEPYSNLHSNLIMRVAEN